MDNKFIQPDQDNMNAKMKFISNDKYEGPLFRNICDFQNNDLTWGVDGKLSKTKVSMSTQYTKNSSDIISDDMDDEMGKQFFPGFSTVNNSEKCMFTEEEQINDTMEATDHLKVNKMEQYNRDYSCSEKSRYLDHSSYIPGGTLRKNNYGNIDEYTKPKYGVSTRNNRETISDKEIDRFHYTFRQYQHPHTGSNPLPEDTRRINKQYL